MFPLAQIKCSDLPPLPGYPDSGYLQFYISVKSDNLYGMDFDDQTSQKNFRVLYFREEEVADPETDFNFLVSVLREEDSPVPKPYSLSFEGQDDYLGLVEVGRSRGLLAEMEKTHPQSYSGMQDELYKIFSNDGHKIGGYAYFTQSDPRDYRKEYEDWVLLFQIDSKDDIMWGDVGVANFFIHPDDLRRRDFSKILYNCDCC